MEETSLGLAGPVGISSGHICLQVSRKHFLSLEHPPKSSGEGLKPTNLRQPPSALASRPASAPSGGRSLPPCLPHTHSKLLFIEPSSSLLRSPLYTPASPMTSMGVGGRGDTLRELSGGKEGLKHINHELGLLGL